MPKSSEISRFLRRNRINTGTVFAWKQIFFYVCPIAKKQLRHPDNIPSNTIQPSETTILDTSMSGSTRVETRFHHIMNYPPNPPQCKQSVKNIRNIFNSICKYRPKQATYPSAIPLAEFSTNTESSNRDSYHRVQICLSYV